MNLLDEIRQRKASTRWGVGLASVYLRQLETACDPCKHLGVSAESWSKAMTAAENRLTYCDPEMVIDGTDPVQVADWDVEPIKTADGKTVEVAVLKRKKREPTPGSVLEFDAVITSALKDRDGDILEPKGAAPDLKMALLWQHIPMEPIGKLLEITQQNNKRVKGRFAVIDSPLGRDAAQLIEFEALRISHGFLPTEWEELKSKDDDEWTGWHFTKYEIMEVSVVSVPSNVDAVITAFSREKLFHPAVKEWAKGLYDKRAVIVPGAKFFDSAEYSKAALAAPAVAKATEGQTVDASTINTAALTQPDADSEQCTTGLHALLHRHYGMMPAEIDKLTVGHVVGMLDGIGKGELPEEYYVMTPGELLEWDKQQDTAEYVDWLNSKAGRALSKTNETRIRNARDSVAAIVNVEETPLPAKALAREALSDLDAVLESVAEEDEPDKQVTIGQVAAYLATTNLEEVRDLSAVIETRLQQAERGRWRRALDAALGRN